MVDIGLLMYLLNGLDMPILNADSPRSSGWRSLNFLLKTNGFFKKQNIDQRLPCTSGEP